MLFRLEQLIKEEVMSLEKPSSNNESKAAGEAMEIIGGFAMFGAVGASVFAVAGEVYERLLPIADSFPGGTVAKIAGGLGVAAAGLIGGSHYLQNR